MIEETIPVGSTITYQGIDYTTEAQVNVLKVQALDTSTDTTSDSIVAPEAPQPSTEPIVEDVAPDAQTETVETTEAIA